MNPFDVLWRTLTGPLTSTRVQLLPRQVNGNNASFGTASANSVFSSLGHWTGTYSPAGGASSNFNWRLTGASADYDIMATLSSGDTPSGTLGSWLNLASTRTWGLTAGQEVSLTCVLAVSIRDAATLVTICGPVLFTIDAQGGIQ